MAAEYSSLPEILDFLFEEKPVGSWEELAGELGIQPSKLSRLKNGKAIPSPYDLKQLSSYTGLPPASFRMPFDKFKRAYQDTHATHMAWTFNLTRQFIGNAPEFCDHYVGQYVLYTQSERNRAMRSLLTIYDEQHTPRFHLVNPYYRSEDDVTAFEYTGYALGAEQYVYFVGEQTRNEYELIYLAFFAPRGADADLMRGIMSGIGVRREIDFVASVPAVLVRMPEEITDWRNEIGSTLGWVQISELRKDIQRHLAAQSLIVR